jgi:hypothetical protein
MLSNNNLLTNEEIKRFIEMYRFPFVMNFDQETAEKVFGNK